MCRHAYCCFRCRCSSLLVLFSMLLLFVTVHGAAVAATANNARGVVVGAGNDDAGGDVLIMPSPAGAPTMTTTTFCKHFAHLAMCQLRHQLTQQVGPLLDSAIGEIDYLTGGGGEEGSVEQSTPGMMPCQDGNTMVVARKRALPTLVASADPEVLAQLSSSSSSKPSRSTMGGRRRFAVPGWLFGMRHSPAAAAAAGTTRRQPSSGTLRIVPVAQQQKLAPFGAMFRQLFKMA